VPVVAMIRPRAGDFVWSEAEVVMMKSDIAAIRAAGLQGVVLGASRPDGWLDVPVLAHLVSAAEGMDLTLHRCIDLAGDMERAVDAAVALGFHRILTSGGETTAEAGSARLASMIRHASGRISIMPGSGVNPGNAAMLKGLGIWEIHASCSASSPLSGRVVEMGFAPPVRRQTDANAVRALRAALE
jgi:copper homeostasis protein